MSPGTEATNLTMDDDGYWAVITDRDAHYFDLRGKTVRTTPRRHRPRMFDSMRPLSDIESCQVGETGRWTTHTDGWSSGADQVQHFSSIILHIERWIIGRGPFSSHWADPEAPAAGNSPDLGQESVIILDFVAQGERLTAVSRRDPPAGSADVRDLLIELESGEQMWLTWKMPTTSNIIREWFDIPRLISHVGSSDETTFLTVNRADESRLFAQCCGRPGLGFVVELGVCDEAMVVGPVGAAHEPEICVTTNPKWPYRGVVAELHSAEATAAIFFEWLTNCELLPGIEYSYRCDLLFCVLRRLMGA